MTLLDTSSHEPTITASSLPFIFTHRDPRPLHAHRLALSQSYIVGEVAQPWLSYRMVEPPLWRTHLTSRFSYMRRTLSLPVMLRYGVYLLLSPSHCIISRVPRIASHSLYRSRHAYTERCMHCCTNTLMYIRNLPYGIPGFR